MSPLPWARILVGVLVVFLLVVAGGWWWLEQEARGPAVAEGMWWSRDCCDIDSPYDARLRRMFPVGSSEAALRETLAAQGFEFQEDGKAVALWSDLVCGYFADVEWDADDAGRVTAVKGDVGSACL